MVVTEHQPGSQERNRPFLLDKDFAQRMMQKIAGFDETITVYEASDHPDKDQHVFDLRMQKGQALAEILEFQANPNNPQVIKGIISTYPGEIIHRASQNTAHFVSVDTQDPANQLVTESPLHFIRRPGVIDDSDVVEQIIGRDNRTDSDNKETFIGRTKDEAATLYAYEQLAERLGKEAKIHAEELTEDFLLRRILELRDFNFDYRDYWKIRVGLFRANDEHPAKMKIDLRMNYDRYIYHMPPPEAFDEGPQRIMRENIGEYDFGDFKDYNANVPIFTSNDALRDTTTTEKIFKHGASRDPKPSPLLVPPTPEVILVAPVHTEQTIEPIVLK